MTNLPFENTLLVHHYVTPWNKGG